MMKKCIFTLFIVLFVANDFLWACADSLTQNQHGGGKRLSDKVVFFPGSKNMLSIASLIAHASGSQKVTAYHVILANLTRVLSPYKEIKDLNHIDLIDNTLVFNVNTLFITFEKLDILNELITFLLAQSNVPFFNMSCMESCRIQTFLSDQLNVWNSSTVPFVEWEWRLNGFLTLDLGGDMHSVPKIPYDVSVNALWKKAIAEKEKEIGMKVHDLDDETFFVTEEHFFLAVLDMMTVDPNESSYFFLDIVNSGSPLRKDFFHKLNKARQTLLRISRK